MFRIALSCLTLPVAALALTGVCHQEPGGPPAQRPYGLEKRLPLTTSTVVGSPDPLPPYRVRKVFADLKLDHPIAVHHQAGSDRLLVITQKHSYGPTKLQRIMDDPKTSDVETLLTHNATAYDICFHPDYATNGYFYVSSNGPDQGPRPKKTQIHRYSMQRQPPYQ